MQKERVIRILIESGYEATGILEGDPPYEIYRSPDKKLFLSDRFVANMWVSYPFHWKSKKSTEAGLIEFINLTA